MELTKQNKKGGVKEKMKLFVWKAIRCDYTCGIGFAMARNVDEAREVIKKSSEDWEWEAYKKELDNDYEVYEIPTGVWIHGGA